MILERHLSKIAEYFLHFTAGLFRRNKFTLPSVSVCVSIWKQKPFSNLWLAVVTTNAFLGYSHRDILWNWLSFTPSLSPSFITICNIGVSAFITIATIGCALKKSTWLIWCPKGNVALNLNRRPKNYVVPVKWQVLWVENIVTMGPLSLGLVLVIVGSLIILFMK